MTLKQSTQNISTCFNRVIDFNWLLLNALAFGYVRVRLRYDLRDSDHIAFMFNVGTFPDLIIHPIDTNICMRHLRHNI